MNMGRAVLITLVLSMLTLAIAYAAVSESTDQVWDGVGDLFKETTSEGDGMKSNFEETGFEEKSERVPKTRKFKV